MCGIAGFVGRNGLELSHRERMLAGIRHRGPDAQGVWQEDSVTLLHARLSIIDLSPSGSQPMASSDGRYVLVYNGEIYNYRELRTELEGSWQFRGSSDTEVLLAAVSCWKANALRRLNGIYAFAVWDRLNRELWLARDAMGVKPLYYYHSPQGLAFSSEIKGLLPLLPGPHSDFASLHEFMFYGAPLEETRCIREYSSCFLGSPFGSRSKRSDSSGFANRCFRRKPARGVSPNPTFGKQSRTR